MAFFDRLFDVEALVFLALLVLALAFAFTPPPAFAFTRLFAAFGLAFGRDFAGLAEARGGAAGREASVR